MSEGDDVAIGTRECEFDAVAKHVTPHAVDEWTHPGWYVYWWRKDGTAHGSRGRGRLI